MTGITIVDLLYYHPQNEEAISVECKTSITVGTDEQPYLRRYKIDTEWQALDLGWLKGKKVSFVVIKNITGRGLTKIPTPEEDQAIKDAVLHIHFQDRGSFNVPPHPEWSNPHLLILPGLGQRLTPYDCEMVYLRSAKGSCDVMISVFPG